MNVTNPISPAVKSPRIYTLVLWLLALLLVVALFSCASGSNERRAADSSAAPGSSGEPMRLLLAGSEARDSAAVVTDFYVDQALRHAFDSIPGARYLTLNNRDSLATLFVTEGKKGVPLDELGKRLDLDGAIFTRFARFGNVLAAEVRVVNPADAKVLYRDLSFSLIRYRDTSGTLLLGPTVYDVLWKSVAKYFNVPHTPERPVATAPLVIAAVTIPSEKALGQLSTNRQTISTQAVKALGEYARLHFAELVAFDYASRNALYRTVNIGAVDDYVAMDPVERTALYNIGIDRYLTASAGLEGDSLRLRVELRHVTSRTGDSLVDFSDTTVARTRFESTKTEEEFVIALIDLAEPLYEREADRIRAAYDARRGKVSPGAPPAGTEAK